jgi:hypothetical protein
MGRPILGLTFAGTVGCGLAFTAFGEGGVALVADLAAVVGLVRHFDEAAMGRYLVGLALMWSRAVMEIERRLEALGFK